MSLTHFAHTVIRPSLLCSGLIDHIFFCSTLFNQVVFNFFCSSLVVQTFFCSSQVAHAFIGSCQVVHIDLTLFKFSLLIAQSFFCLYPVSCTVFCCVSYLLSTCSPLILVECVLNTNQFTRTSNVSFHSCLHTYWRARVVPLADREARKLNTTSCRKMSRK